MCHCILGKASLAVTEGPQDEPCPQMAQVSGLSQQQDILGKLKQSVIQLQGPSRSCEKEFVAQPTRSLYFRQELWRQELQDLMTHFPSSAGPAVGDKTYLWDIATVLDFHFHRIQNWAKFLTFSFSSWKQNNDVAYFLLLSAMKLFSYSEENSLSGELPEICFFSLQILIKQKICMLNYNWTEELRVL